VVIDLGTGDGRAVLAVASQEPESLAIGVDANAASMAESSRRAARSSAKGGLPNALFVASSVEALPTALCGTADLVTITLPWGSLLQAVLCVNPAASEAIARLPKPGGIIRTVVSVAERDGVPGVPALDTPAVAGVAARQALCGLDLLEARQATAADVAKTHSSWAKRLRANSDRAIWLLEFMRC
jgi:16S rRNA (adenine(1408)-N(1))-methyltransferase